MGGAEIDIATATIYSPVQDTITTELMSATNIATSTLKLSNIACQKAVYQNTYAPGIPSQDTSIYCSRRTENGTDLWKIYFSYRAGDTTGAAHTAEFNDILGSMQLF